MGGLQKTATGVIVKETCNERGFMEENWRQVMGGRKGDERQVNIGDECEGE